MSSQEDPKICDFVRKLLSMMQEFPELIGWGSHGEELVIYKEEEFSNRVLQKYFRHSKFESFVRQLNMYNFHKVCRNKNSINFRNRYFYEGNHKNFHLIKRRKKDAEDENQDNGRLERNLTALISEKHHRNFPELSSMVSQILEFKSKSSKTVSKLRKSLDLLNRQINERKGKIVKPIVSDIKQMISSIEDTSKKTDMDLQKMTESLEKQSLSTDNLCSAVKQENLSHPSQNNLIEYSYHSRSSLDKVPRNKNHNKNSNFINQNFREKHKPHALKHTQADIQRQNIEAQSLMSQGSGRSPIQQQSLHQSNLQRNYRAGYSDHNFSVFRESVYGDQYHYQQMSPFTSQNRQMTNHQMEGMPMSFPALHNRHSNIFAGLNGSAFNALSATDAPSSTPFNMASICNFNSMRNYMP